MAAELKLRMRNSKMRVLPNCKELVVNWNRRAVPEEISEHNDPNRIEWTEVSAQRAPDHFTGHAALRLPDDSRPRYRLFWPIRNGWLNETDYDNRNQLYHDISKIFEDAFRSHLGLDPKDLGSCSCVFIIPDLYERSYVTMLLDILIRDLGLGRVCLQQESLSATFGAGYSISCIVDIGAQKTSICCVDEGLCIEESRVNLKMGGADVTEAFVKMMLYDHFPYADMNIKRRYDFLLAEELKQKLCTLVETDVAVTARDFHLRVSGQDTRKYSFKTYDEPMLCAMVSQASVRGTHLTEQGLFKPSIFDHSSKLSSRRKVIPRSVDLYDGSPNDSISAAQLAILELGGGKLSGMGGASGTNGTSSFDAAHARSTPSRSGQQAHSRAIDTEETPRSSIAGSPVPEGTPNADRDTPAGGDLDKPVLFYDPVLEKTKLANERDRVLPMAPLDVAICESIGLGARGDDRKMRDFFGGIMLVGGGSKIHGLNMFLERKLHERKPGFTKEILIGTPPRELDPQVLVWKGGSVFGKLSPSGNDSWISKAEYDMLGSRLLVNKCMFIW